MDRDGFVCIPRLLPHNLCIFHSCGASKSSRDETQADVQQAASRSGGDHEESSLRTVKRDGRK